MLIESKRNRIQLIDQAILHYEEISKLQAANQSKLDEFEGEKDEIDKKLEVAKRQHLKTVGNFSTVFDFIAKQMLDSEVEARVEFSGKSKSIEPVMHITSHPHFNADCECLAVLFLNTRKRVKGHQIVSIGTMDTILVHPREVFRVAIMTAASALIVMHNHPSGESTPSEADIKVTRDLIRAGQLLKIELLDHVVIGNGNRSSLRELGYFYA